MRIPATIAITLVVAFGVTACPNDEPGLGDATITDRREISPGRAVLRLLYPNGSTVDFGPVDVPNACAVGALYPTCTK